MLQAIGHPAAYEDLLEDVDQPPFTQAIATPTWWSSSAHQLYSSSMEHTALAKVPHLALTGQSTSLLESIHISFILFYTLQSLFMLFSFEYFKLFSFLLVIDSNRRKILTIEPHLA